MNTLHKAALAAALGLSSAQVAHAQTQPTDQPAHPAHDPSTAAPRSDTTGTPRTDPTNTPRNPASGTTPSTSSDTASGSADMPTGDTSATSRSITSSESGAASGSRASILSSQETVSITGMNDAAARSIQTKLQEVGFYQGEIDGIVGPQTKRALREFYRAQADLVSQGKLLADSASLFDLSAADIQPVRGEDESPRGAAIPGTGRGSMGTGTTGGSATGTGTTGGSSMGTSPSSTQGAGSATQQGTSGTSGARRPRSTQGATMPSDTNATQGTGPSQGTGTTQGTGSTPGSMPNTTP
jgi:hypothetical protein